MCVLHNEPLFLPVDTHHNQCPRQFFHPTRAERYDKLRRHKNYDTFRDRTGFDRHDIHVCADAWNGWMDCIILMGGAGSGGGVGGWVDGWIDGWVGGRMGASNR